jgi:electron transport complex protein RnfD
MQLRIENTPHIRAKHNTRTIMLDVVIALLPALLVGVIVLGIRSLLVVFLSMVSAVLFEYLYCLITKSDITIFDGSALVTGLLLALTLPASVPLWQVVVGNLFAIVLVKKFFGGIGENIFNPALAARAFLMLIYPAGLTIYKSITVDGVTGATPLHNMVMPSLPNESLLDMFLGNCPGSIGEISALALLIGFVYLLVRKVISFRIPVTYIFTVFVLTLIFSKTGQPFKWALYNVLSGGLMLGAIFMATDYTTSPVTPLGQIIYGVGCGILNVIFRYFGLFPEGVTYAILIMNALVWLIDQFTAPRRFGCKKGGIF